MIEILCPYCQNKMTSHNELDYIHRGRGRKLLMVQRCTCKECGRDIYTVVDEDTK